MYSEILKRELLFKEDGHERLNVFRISYKLSMEIFEISKRFPKEEMYSLTDQIRRSSRSVSANIREGYGKRVYPKSFSSKMVDADGEATETAIHLKFSMDCGYMNRDLYVYFTNAYDEVGRMLNGMINNPEKFIPQKNNRAKSATVTATATIHE